METITALSSCILLSLATVKQPHIDEPLDQAIAVVGRNVYYRAGNPCGKIGCAENGEQAKQAPFFILTKALITPREARPHVKIPRTKK